MFIPAVSVIMAIRNEASFIKDSLGSILAQDYPENQLEIIVVDGMSNDGTRDIVQTFVGTHKNIKLVDNPGQIVSKGLNIAIKASKGEIIVRVDGHTKIAPDYVRLCVLELKRSGADNVGGKMNVIGRGLFGKTVALATSSPFGVGSARFRYSDKEEWVDTVYMGAWNRKLFDLIGMFDEEQVRNQDDEFNYRILENGGKIFLSQRIKSLYIVRDNPRALWKQYFQYGYWKVRVMQKHPRQMRASHFIPMLFVGFLTISLLFAPFYFLARCVFTFITGSYMLTNLGASAWKSRKGNWFFLPLLPLVFAILHLSYGIGFINGLFKFRNRWRIDDSHAGNTRLPALRREGD